MGRGWERGGQFTSNLRPRWTGSYHAKEGFQVRKRVERDVKRELARGVKTRGLRHDIVVNVYTCI
jgi:hypothetical protein